MKGQVDRAPVVDTEIGRFPSDWTIEKLGEILSSTQLGGNYPNSLAETDAPLIKMGNLGRGSISLERLEYVTAGKGDERDKLYPGDLLFNTRNTPELVGKVAIWRDELPVAFYNSNIMRMKFKSSAVSSYDFMNAIFNSSSTVDRLRAIATGTTSVAAIYTRDLVEFRIPIPPKPEQVAIGEALGAADELLRALELTLRKKQAIRDELHRGLLTGMRRLGGHSNEWRAAKAGQVGRFYGGSGFPLRWQGSESGVYPFFKVSDLSRDGNERYLRGAPNYVTDEVRKELGARAFPKGAIVFAKVGAAVFLERKRLLGQPSCLDNNLCGFVIDDNTNDVRFIHYLLQQIKLGDRANTTALPSLSTSVLNDIELKLPNKDEQAAIADILDEFAIDITALEARITKSMRLRSGMAQALLSGSVRL